MFNCLWISGSILAFLLAGLVVGLTAPSACAFDRRIKSIFLVLKEASHLWDTGGDVFGLPLFELVNNANILGTNLSTLSQNLKVAALIWVFLNIIIFFVSLHISFFLIFLFKNFYFYD